MCGIFAAFNTKTFNELAKLNQYRGYDNYSITALAPMPEGVQSELQGAGKIPEYGSKDRLYKIGHVQASTSPNSRIHPVEYREVCMIHNGIVKASGLSDDDWDTEYLLMGLYNASDPEIFLSDLNGSFACILWDTTGGIVVFRNQTSPLFYDNKLNLSSTKFPGSKELPVNKVFHFDLATRKMTEVGAFENKQSHYFILEEDR